MCTLAGSADPASQLGVFADRSESDEELLEADPSASVTTPQRGRGKRQRARGSSRKSAASGCLITSHTSSSAAKMSVVESHSPAYRMHSRKGGAAMLVFGMPQCAFCAVTFPRTVAGGRAEKNRGRAGGRGQRGRAGRSESKEPTMSKPVSLNIESEDVDDDIDWEPAS